MRRTAWRTTCALKGLPGRRSCCPLSVAQRFLYLPAALLGGPLLASLLMPARFPGGEHEVKGAANGRGLQLSGAFMTGFLRTVWGLRGRATGPGRAAGDRADRRGSPPRPTSGLRRRGSRSCRQRPSGPRSRGDSRRGTRTSCSGASSFAYWECGAGGLRREREASPRIWTRGFRRCSGRRKFGGPNRRCEKTPHLNGISIGGRARGAGRGDTVGIQSKNSPV